MNSRTRSFVAVSYTLCLVSALLGEGCLQRKLKPLNPCLVSGVVEAVSVSNIDKVDMLFMVDNSDSMADKQTKLRDQFPHLITVLTTGILDGNTTVHFPPVKNLHLGVVTSDMGLPGVQGIQGCQGLGQDGILQSKPSAAVAGCQASYPPFLGFEAGMNDPVQIAKDFQCIAVVGTGGCGFEHQLEAPLKALWPSADNRILFLADPVTGEGQLGHGDVENTQFLRNDPTKGLSLIAIIELTDEDDCSAADTRPYTLPRFLDPADPLAMESMNLRCYFNKSSLYPVERYVKGFKALRPDNDKLVIFAAITGVPQDLVDLTKNPVKFDDETERDAWYDKILGDSRMQEVVNDRGTADPTDDTLRHSCVEDVPPAGGNQAAGQLGAADPPIRIVNVAKGFGANGIVQSICQSDFGPALDSIIALIGKQLDAVCLPRPLVRSSSGTVGCNVIWELPPPGQAMPGTPTTCGGQFPWLIAPPANEQQTADGSGGQICRVVQLPVQPGSDRKPAPQTAPMNGQSFVDGWYYDDFSNDVKTCLGTTKQRVSFTPNAKPPTGVTVKLDCLNERQSLSNSRTDIVTQPAQPAVGASCEDMKAQKRGDAACYVELLQPSAKWPDGIDKSMFCHPTLNVCVLGCATDADCPAAWICDSRPETLSTTVRTSAANGTAICVNPTCGDVM